MIGYHDREPLVSGVHGGTLGHCPGLEYAAYLQTEIVMKPARPVFMDDESKGLFRGHEQYLAPR
jgi:hypothetical protein